MTEVSYTTMATKLPKAPIGRAYDITTNKAVNANFDYYFPANGVEATLQWHLTRLGDLGSVWADYTGKGVHVGVYDEGTQSTHWDLAANYDASRHVVIDGVAIAGDAVAMAHGTSVSGLIAAARNDRGGVGVAYDATITGVNIFDPLSPIFLNRAGSKFVDAMFQMNRFDLVNNSWGGGSSAIQTQFSRSTEGSFANVMAQAQAFAAETGRSGLGTIVVSAAGNNGADLQVDGMKTDRHSVTVGAYRQADGVASSFSSRGDHLLVSAPSSEEIGLGRSGIVTTDLLGEAGYNASFDPLASADYTDRFGGTSAAAPIVSGVVALMLDANENLGWRDVRNILAASAKMPLAFGTGPVNYKYAVTGQVVDASLNENSMRLSGDTAGWNGGAMHYSGDYGYGAVDAYNAVRMAEVWSLFKGAQTSRNEVSATTGVLPVGMTADSSFFANRLSKTEGYGDILGDPAKFKFTVTDSLALEHVDLTVDFSGILNSVTADGTIIRSDVTLPYAFQLKLIAPDGSYGFTFQPGAPDPTTSNQEYMFGFSGLRGVETKGEWTLEVQPFDTFLMPFFGINFDQLLTVNSVKMDMYGGAVSNDDVYTYTDEFFQMADIRGEASRKTLIDTDGGEDWINAAAVSSDVVLSLVGGQATSIDGERAFAIGRTSVIENAVTGDGDDTLIGNRFDNFLVAMRGNDTLNGGAGNDWLIGGTGTDRFLFDNRGTSGKDLVLDFAGGDMIGTQTALRGAGTDGKVTVAANTLLLLDGTRTGDTAQLSQQGGAVIQSMGQKDGYFWYAFVSGTDIDSGAVIREESFQPERSAAGTVEALAAMGNAATDLGGTTAPGGFAMPSIEQASFYLYDAMAGSMSGGVLLHA